MRPLWVAALVASVAALASASPKPVVFPDDSSAGRSAPGYALGQGYGQQRQHQDVYRDPGAGGGGSSDARAAAHRFAAAEATATPLPPAQQDSRVLFQQIKRKKKKRKKICSLAQLLAGRDAAGGAVGVDGVQQRAQHRAARAVPGSPTSQQGVQGVQGVQGDGRSYGSGLGLAGFVLGTLVGSKLSYGFHQQPVQQGGHEPPPFTQTQTQVQGPLQPVQPVVPVIPVVPVQPAPVHEDYDDVEDDPTVNSGGYSLCDQLQNRPDPGPLDSHFPIIHGLLQGQGGQGGQRPLYRPPQRPPAYGYYRPPPQPLQHNGGLLYSYIKPWTDLFFK